MDKTQIVVKVQVEGSWQSEDSVESSVIVPIDPKDMTVEAIGAAIAGIAITAAHGAVAYFSSGAHEDAVEKKEERDKQYWIDKAKKLEVEKKEIAEKLDEAGESTRDEIGGRHAAQAQWPLDRDSEP